MKYAGPLPQEPFGRLANRIENAPPAKPLQDQVTSGCSPYQILYFGGFQPAVKGAVGKGDHGRRETMPAQVRALPDFLSGDVGPGLL